MHIVPAPAESLMKSRVLSIPGLQGVMDKGSAAFQTFRERDHVKPRALISDEPPQTRNSLAMGRLLISAERGFMVVHPSVLRHLPRSFLCPRKLFLEGAWGKGRKNERKMPRTRKDGSPPSPASRG